MTTNIADTRSALLVIGQEDKGKLLAPEMYANIRGFERLLDAAARTPLRRWPAASGVPRRAVRSR